VSGRVGLLFVDLWLIPNGLLVSVQILATSHRQLVAVGCFCGSECATLLFQFVWGLRELLYFVTPINNAYCILTSDMSRRASTSQSGNPLRGAKNPRPTPADRDPLRPSNRFLQFCIDCGFTVDAKDQIADFREVELVFDQALSDDVSPSFPPDFGWEEFFDCWTAEDYRQSIDLYSNAPSCARPPIRVGEAGEASLSSSDAVILWLSKTVFLSCFEFKLTNDEIDRQPMFQYGVRFDPFLSGPLYVYSLSTFTVSRTEGFVEPAPPALPMHFFRHVASLAPEDFIRRMNFHGGSRTYFSPQLCTLFLSILPPKETDGRSMPQTNIVFLSSDGYFALLDEQQLEVITTYSYNSQVKVNLQAISDELSLDNANQMLRDSQHIRHLGIEGNLVSFEGRGHSFSSNPRLRSLSIDVENGEISTNLLDGISINTGIQSLWLSFEERIDQEGFRKPLEHLFEQVLPKCRSLRSLSLELTDTDFLHDDVGAALAFHKYILQYIAASSAGKHGNRFGSLVSLRLITKLSSNVVDAPSEIFNRIVSPSLALNWCQQSRNEHSWATSAVLAVPEGLVPSMVRATNQDIVYVKTTGETPPDISLPFDSRTANAAVIYDLVRSFRASFS
jgi:hypothetical protein